MIIPTPAQPPLLQPMMATETTQAPPLLGEVLPQPTPVVIEQQPPALPPAPPAVALPTELPLPPLPPPEPPTLPTAEEQRLEQLKEELASALGVSPEYLTGALSLALPSPGESPLQMPRRETSAGAGAGREISAAGLEASTAPLPLGLTPLQIAQEQLDMAEQLHAALLQSTGGTGIPQSAGFRLVIPQITTHLPQARVQQPPGPPAVPAAPAVIVTQAPTQVPPYWHLPGFPSEPYPQQPQQPQQQIFGAPAPVFPSGVLMPPPPPPPVPVPPSSSYPQDTADFETEQMAFLQVLQAAQAAPRGAEAQEGGGHGTARAAGGLIALPGVPLTSTIPITQPQGGGGPFQPPTSLFPTAFQHIFQQQQQQQQQHLQQPQQPSSVPQPQFPIGQTCTFQPLAPLNLPQLIMVPHTGVVVPQPPPTSQQQQQQRRQDPFAPPPTIAPQYSQSAMVSTAVENLQLPQAGGGVGGVNSEPLMPEPSQGSSLPDVGPGDVSTERDQTQGQG